MERCDGVDNDCDSTVDEDDAQDAGTFYTDGDGDGYGSPSTPVQGCTMPAGSVDNFLDCDDADVATSPDGTESCTDGADNDCDGLTDCEDGECMGDVSCEEDCSDGRDNDYNGLTDCEDTACWWLEDCDHPAGAYVTILGGNMEIENRWSRHGEYGAWWWDGERHQLDATGVWGTVRVLPEGVASWAGATTSTTCSWGVDTLSGSQSSYSASGGLNDECSATRRGFWIDPGCRLSTSGFLPPALAPNGADVSRCEMVFTSWMHTPEPAIGGLWYSGHILESSFTSRSSPSDSYSYSFSEQTWYRASITGSPTHLVYP